MLWDFCYHTCQTYFLMDSKNASLQLWRPHPCLSGICLRILSKCFLLGTWDLIRSESSRKFRRASLSWSLFLCKSCRNFSFWGDFFFSNSAVMFLISFSKLIWIRNGQFVFHFLDLAIDIKLKNKFVKTYYKQISNYTLIYPFLTMFRYEILCAFTFVVKVNCLILRIQTSSLQGICACCLQQYFPACLYVIPNNFFQFEFELF